MVKIITFFILLVVLGIFSAQFSGGDIFMVFIFGIVALLIFFLRGETWIAVWKRAAARLDLQYNEVEGERVGSISGRKNGLTVSVTAKECRAKDGASTWMTFYKILLDPLSFDFQFRIVRSTATYQPPDKLIPYLPMNAPAWSHCRMYTDNPEKMDRFLNKMTEPVILDLFDRFLMVDISHHELNVRVVDVVSSERELVETLVYLMRSADILDDAPPEQKQVRLPENHPSKKIVFAQNKTPHLSPVQEKKLPPLDPIPDLSFEPVKLPELKPDLEEIVVTPLPETDEPEQSFPPKIVNAFEGDQMLQLSKIVDSLYGMQTTIIERNEILTELSGRDVVYEGVLSSVGNHFLIGSGQTLALFFDVGEIVNKYGSGDKVKMVAYLVPETVIPSDAVGRMIRIRAVFSTAEFFLKTIYLKSAVVESLI